MRGCFGWAILALSLASNLQAAPPDFPYRAFINRPEVYVRSGPGDEYYPTDRLKPGDEVEIYRHDPGGWYAIRPPEGSFTWISGRHLQVGKDRLATVTSDRVAARVGSKFSEIRDVIQVRLQKGEVVEVLDVVTAPGANGEKAQWYKIAPPAGEFRWVFGKYVDRQYIRDGVAKSVAPPAAAASDSPPPTPAPAPAQPVAAPPAVAEAAPPQSASAQGGVVAASATQPLKAPPMRQMSPEEYQAELDDLDLKLSVMLAEEVTVWSFDQLRPRAEMMLEQAQTAVERGKARLLLNKIARFEEIKKRNEAVAALRQQVDQRSQQLAGLSRQKGELVTNIGDDRFDGTGRLTRVVSPSNGGPRFALLEPNGQVRCYVSPAPGVNLQHYVGRDVGVTGVRGYMPEQRAHHVMAKNVTVLEDTRLR